MNRFRLGIVFLVLMGLFVGFIPCANAQTEADKESEKKKPRLEIPDSLRATYKFTDGLKRYHIHRDTVGAMALFEEALKIDSTHSPSLYQMASHYLREDVGRANALAEKAYRQDTMSRWYTAIYAQSSVILGDYEKALPLYRRLLEMDKTNPDTYRVLALLYQQRKQPYSAISVLDSAEMRVGKYDEMTALKRHLLITTGQTDRAIKEAQEQVEEAPYEPKNHLALGQTYMTAGKDSLANVTLRRAIEMDSTSVEALLTYADFTMRRQDMPAYLKAMRMLFAQDSYPLEKKIEIFEMLTKDRKFYGRYFFDVGALASTLMIKYPSEKRVVDLYGEHLLAGGDVKMALRHFKLHLKDEPPQLDYYMAVIDMEEYLKNADSVDYYVVRATEIFPDDPKLYIRKANRQYVKGDLDATVESFKHALTLTSDSLMQGEIWGFIGDTYHAMAERRTAQLKAKIKRDTSAYPVKLKPQKAQELCYAAYDNALRLNGDNASVLNNYAYFLSEEERDLGKALEMSSKAIKLTQNNPTFLDTHAWILYLLDRKEEARTFMRQALSLDSEGNSTLQLHYGDILFALGEKFMAETYWKRALEAGADKAEVERRLEYSKKNASGVKIHNGEPKK